MNSVEIVVPEVRDYQRITAQVVHSLDAGATLVRLVGVDRQRLLLAGLAGPWQAIIVVEGASGPELAAGLNAPGLTILATSDVDDGAAARLREGRVLVIGRADDGLATGMTGGLVVVLGGAGHRAGLRQRGGRILIRGDVGRLAGDRRTGGVLDVDSARLAAQVGRPGFVGDAAPWTSAASLLTIEDSRAFEAALHSTGRSWTPEISQLRDLSRQGETNG